jgi:alpha-tubulin suppressor-like RCC1 family protein
MSISPMKTDVLSKPFISYILVAGTEHRIGGIPTGGFKKISSMKKILLVFVLLGWGVLAKGQSISAGTSHCLFLCSNSAPASSGNNQWGQLGNATVVNQAPYGVGVIGMNNIVSVSAGFGHSIFLKNDGTVWTWGRDTLGELGDGGTTRRDTAARVMSLSGIIQVFATNLTSYFLKNNGTVWACGRNNMGQLGDGTQINRTIPVQVSGLTNVVSISAGDQHVLFLKNNGTVWACGLNVYGQLGDSLVSNFTTVPVQVLGLTGIVDISGAGHHSMFLKNDGTVWACGDNSFGQLGDGTTVTRRTVIQIQSLQNIVRIEGGFYHSLFLKGDRTVSGCGWNENGQIGDGTTTQRNTPVQTLNLNYVADINTSVNHSLFKYGDGRIWACGDNTWGQLCDGSYIDKHTPVQSGPCLSSSSLAMTTIQTNISCNGNDGIATAIPIGGWTPYSYSWSTGATTATINNLSIGTYTATITDYWGFTATQTVTIAQSAALNSNLTSNNATCSSCNDGSATVIASGGTSPYTYSWSPNSATTATVSNLLPGNYTCCVTDANGCSTCSGVTVNFNCTAPTIQASNLTFTNVTSNSITVNWTNGNGTRRIVRVKTVNSFTAPANATDYIANPVYLGGEQTVYNGTGNSVTVTGLAPHHIYWFKVYEANCSANNSMYSTAVATGNPRQRITAAASPSNNPNRPEAVAEEEENVFAIVPNPNRGTFTVSMKKESGIGNWELEIVDITGRIVYDKIINQQSEIINQNFSAGVYFLRVSAGERVFTRKLIIE